MTKGKYLGRIVAIKTIQPSRTIGSSNERQFKEVEDEMLCLEYLKGPRTVQLFGYYIANGTMKVVMELAPYCSLGDILHNFDKFPESSFSSRLSFSTTRALLPPPLLSTHPFSATRSPATLPHLYTRTHASSPAVPIYNAPPQQPLQLSATSTSPPTKSMRANPPGAPRLENVAQPSRPTVARVWPCAPLRGGPSNVRIWPG